MYSICFVLFFFASSILLNPNENQQIPLAFFTESDRSGASFTVSTPFSASFICTHFVCSVCDACKTLTSTVYRTGKLMFLSPKCQWRPPRTLIEFTSYGNSFERKQDPNKCRKISACPSYYIIIIGKTEHAHAFASSTPQKMHLFSCFSRLSGYSHPVCHPDVCTRSRSRRRRSLNKWIETLKVNK